MKKIYFLLSFFSSVLACDSLFAQQDLTMYNMESVPQRLYVNPAFIPTSSNIYIGLPVLSSQYFSLSNSGFKYSDAIKHSGDSLALDFNNLLSKLAKNNYLSASYRIDLLSFGFKIKKNYFSFNATEKVDVSIRYPKSFMELLWKGNGGVLGQQEDLTFGLNATHYREYGVGYAREINDKLTIGGKVKYLYGMENISTKNFDVSLTTDPTDFAITAKSNININTSGFDNNATSNFNFMDYAFKRKNKGAGIDLGGVYKYNDKFTFSASVVDLGFIKWQNSPNNYQSNNTNGQFTFQGLDLNQVLNSNDSSKNSTKVLTDSLAKTFKIDSLHKSYTTMLSTKIYLSANYKLTEKINTGVLFYSQIFDKAIHPGVALSYNQKVGRWLNFSASYSIYNRSYNNFGLGFSLNGPVQFYIVSDNLLGAFFPQNAKNIQLHFGINILIGRKSKDKDKDGVPDKKDDCPDVAGLKALKGCPDKDGDGIADKDDACPDEKGLEKFKGCPDKDADGVMDKEDLCPDIAGLVELKGCPDKDGDGIADKDDACPDEKGLAQFKGCPDKDGDGVMDKEDACPDEKGSIALKGCPDKDGDGVPDKTDACPDKAGSISNNGCPETKLVLIDSLGNPLRSAVRGKDGSFTFTGTVFNEHQLFKLEGNNTDTINEIVIVIGDITRKATRVGSDKVFHYEYMKSDENKLKKVGEDDVAIKLSQKEAEVLKTAFSNLEFTTGKDVIVESSYASLDELAGLMTKKPNWRLKISGHTDNKGDAMANLKLSQKRAEAIKKYLMTKGISADRFKVEWFGSSKPIADNKTEAGRQKNRRVEMLIIQ
jgi:outer membrane protein OmpA-like peptidoglycan-associated protein